MVGGAFSVTREGVGKFAGVDIIYGSEEEVFDGRISCKALLVLEECQLIGVFEGGYFGNCGIGRDLR